ncbi:YybH family protein [Streptomyces sp. NPDC058861]|uniref:YybH family protein n=1 Tax=Streptomyces sp. NPDC058861 TaxID=3346653 RepID=UPI0036BF9F64
MGNDSEQIRTLVERWAGAVHRGHLDTVVEDHAEDIVMFDVPPPYEGVRGIDSYREVWPAFFEWQAQGAVFDVEELEVTAGRDVAFAHALVRCGTEEELAARPGFRMRLTLGLRKEAGRWVVAHEHHSFPDLSGSEPRSEDETEGEGEGEGEAKGSA